MSTSQDFVGALLQAFTDAMLPLDGAISSPDGMAAFLAEFGWHLDPASDQASIVTIFKDIDDAITALTKASTALDAVAAGDDSALATAIANLAIAVGDMVKAIQGLEGGNGQPSWPAPMNTPDFWASFPLEVLDFLVYSFIKSDFPKLYGILRFLGILTRDWTDPKLAGREPYYKIGVAWDQIPNAVAKPKSLFPTVYGWGGTFDHRRFSTNVEQLLWGFNLPGRGGPPDDPLLTGPYYDPAATVVRDVIQIDSPLIYGVETVGPLSALQTVRLIILPIPPAAALSGKPVGFTVFPFAEISAAATFPVTDFATLTISGGLETAPIRLDVRPDGITIATDLAATEITAKAEIDIAPADPLILFGVPQGTRLEVAHAHFSVGADISTSRQEYVLELGLDSMTFVIDFSKSDGFLQKILGSDPQKLDLSSALTYSSKSGFGFRGQAQLEANLAVHLSIADVIIIDSIYVALRASSDGSGAALVVAASGGLDIGPVAATVDRIGLELDLKPVPKGQPPGNLGSLNLGFGFKPPNGLGLVVDAGAVVGGGYIFFDPDKGQYAGVLELALESIQIKAIGILTTKMPDGSSGFSFLVIITTEFTPMELGFGFTLNGVGGLAGINRTMVLDALRTGLKNHALNSILFPVDPVKNAKKVISDVTTIFPPADGRYVFGPMIEIGWGVPTLVIGELGIVLELPSPVRLAILGQIKAAIPTEDEAIIVLHIDVLGTVDFGLKKLAIDATIYDSRLAAFDLLGDMAMRLNWGSDALFILSIGGLHPQFQPPPEFPKLVRLTVSLGAGDNPRLALQAYMAVTSNTLQFGAHLEIYASEAGFTVHGYFGFDALFIFSPFHFVVEMRAGVQIAYNGATLMGIDLDLLLSGPNPWAYDGTASISFLFFSISVHVSGSFGGGTAPELPPAPVMTPLLAALTNRASWSAVLPDVTQRAVTLLAPKPDDAALYVHPRGTLTVVQSVVPLDTSISKFGSASPSDGDKFEIAKVTLDGVEETKTSVPGQFAPAQYNEMSDADKLAAKSFVSFPAGVAIGSTDMATGSGSALDLEYDVQIIDDLTQLARPGPKYQVSMDKAMALSGQGAASRSLVRRTGNAKFMRAGASSAIANTDETFVVAGNDDLKVLHVLGLPAGSNQYQARAALQQHVDEHPEDKDRYQVVLVHEARV